MLIKLGVTMSEEHQIPENLKFFFEELIKIRDDLKKLADEMPSANLIEISDRLQNLLKGS